MNLMYRNSLLAGTFSLLTVTCPQVTTAQTSIDQPSHRLAKPAWEWTLADRFKQRFDPAAMKARAARRAVEQEAAAKWFPSAAEGPFLPRNAASDSSQHDVETIDGNQTPELFLPLELFDHLLLMGFPSSGKDQFETRQIIENRAVPLGFGRDLWQRLGKVAGPYLTLQRQHQRQPGKQLSGSNEDVSQLDADDLLQCRARKEAFAAAAVEFGEGDFRRLLYLGVTPGFSITYAVDDFAEHARYLRFLEGGCQ